MRWKTWLALIALVLSARSGSGEPGATLLFGKQVLVEYVVEEPHNNLEPRVAQSVTVTVGDGIEAPGWLFGNVPLDLLDTRIQMTWNGPADWAGPEEGYGFNGVVFTDVTNTIEPFQSASINAELSDAIFLDVDLEVTPNTIRADFAGIFVNPGQTIVIDLGHGGGGDADLLVSKPVDSSQSRLTSDLGGGEQRGADDFSLLDRSSITGADWYGTFLTSSTFRLEFYVDAGGAPATSPLFSKTVAVTGTDTGAVGTNGQAIIKFSAPLSNLVLDEGNYWFSVADAITTNDLPSAQPWDWQASTPTSGNPATAYRVDDSSSWSLTSNPNKQELAFALHGAPNPPAHLYWTDAFGHGPNQPTVEKATVAGTDRTVLVETATGGFIHGIALDPAGGKMYWATAAFSFALIQRANLDGTGVETIVDPSDGIVDPLGIAVDPSGGKIYWVDPIANKIQRANLDGSSVEDLVTTGIDGPWGIALDLGTGKMYWTDNSTDKIQRANLDGSNVEDLVTTGLDHPVGIALDLSARKMYWLDQSTDKVQRANLDGTDVEDLVPTGHGPFFIALDLSEGRMYWTETLGSSGPGTIQRASLDGSGVVDLITGLSIPIGIALLPKNTPPACNPSGAGVYQIGATVVVGGTVADNDGDLVSFEWREGTTVLFSGAVSTVQGGAPVALPNQTLPTLDLGLGIHTLELAVNDGENDQIVCEIVVEVLDTTDPTIAPVSSHSILWPPNHKMVTVTIQANALDNDGLPPGLDVTVTSDEADNGLGDGDTANDIQNLQVNQATGTITVDLRAERQGGGDGRVYTITIEATDTSGNSSIAEVTVLVPHSKGKKK